MNEAAMNQVMEQAVLQAAQQMEDQLDSQLHAMENLGEDEVERLRKQRLLVRNYCCHLQEHHDANAW